MEQPTEEERASMARALLDGLLKKVLDKTDSWRGNILAVRIDKKSWEMGYTAGLTGQSTQEPPGVDGLSFISGYIEGQADKDKPPSERKPRHRENPA
jgi:hypothetical protein